MCGITGFVDYVAESDEQLLYQMVASMTHRGPDDKGVMLIQSNQAKIGLGHTRLAVIDLSHSGHQPMSHNQLSIVYNGEIYNYKELRSQLECMGSNFKSESDTEVVLHAYEKWGRQAVERFVGMFAYAIYDIKEETLTITRDRTGVKPLYYYHSDTLFLFGSELKPLMAHPGFEKRINASVLRNYLHRGHIAAPFSIFENCYKLEPGHHLILNIQDNSISKKCYWDVFDHYKSDKLNISYDDAKFEMSTLLKSASEYRMVSDVPVGVFLSGGYDSTAITSILQTDRTEKLRTFTIGFNDGYNEAPFAKQTAEYLGTEHTELICTSRHAQQIITDLAFIYDEPFGDSSAIPTALVSQLARQHVTVALSADGGDEVFCGYNYYPKFKKYADIISKVPSSLRPFVGLLGSELGSLIPMSEHRVHQINSFFNAMEYDQMKQAAKLFRLMMEKPDRYISKWLSQKAAPLNSSYKLDEEGFHSELEFAMASDYRSNLPNGILTKVDRATMSVSLEGREPLLDHRIVEFAARLPISYKYEGTTTKMILRDIVHDYIPKSMMDRPKSGFSLPIYKWLRSDLSYLLDEYLTEEALSWSGFFNEKYVASQVDLFRKGRLHYVNLVWHVLMFQMWYDRWMRG